MINTSAIYLFSLIYLFKVFQWRLVQFESKIPASVFITLDQYVSVKYFEPKISKNFKFEVEKKFITLKNPDSVYLQFVCSDYSGKRGYTFYSLTENETKNSFLDKIRLKKLKKRIQSENKGNVLFSGQPTQGVNLRIFMGQMGPTSSAGWFPEKNAKKEFLSRKSDFKRPLQKMNPEQVEHFLKKLSSSSNIRVLEFSPYLNSISTLNPDVDGLPIHKLGSKIIIAMRGSKFL